MSHDNEADHWSQAMWSTHVGGIHVSTIFPVITYIWGDTSILWIALWAAISFVSHKSGLGLIGYFKRIQIKIGKLVHGENRIRKNRILRFKRKRGLL